MTDETITEREALILYACTAAANVLMSRGLELDEIAHGLISYGGAIVLETEGPVATAHLFQSKADGLQQVQQ